MRSDHIVCLEDGKKFMALKKHLRVSHGMTPDEYRSKWALPWDYPIVHPAFAAVRSTLAKASGFGRKPGAKGTGKPRANQGGIDTTTAVPLSAAARRHGEEAYLRPAGVYIHRASRV